MRELVHFSPLAWLGVALLTALTVLVLVLAALLNRTGPIRIRHWVENAGDRLRALFDETERFEVYRYMVGFLARTLPAVLAAMTSLALSLQIESLTTAVLWSLIYVALVVLVAEALCRKAAQRAERSLDRLTFAYKLMLLLVGPLLALLAPLFGGRSDEASEADGEEEDDASDDEIEAFIDVGAREGILEPEEEDLILRVIDFGDEQVRAVMTPRIDMVCAPLGTSLEELATLFVNSNHSRIPLFGESVDDIRGVLHIRDVLGALRSSESVEPEAIAMRPLFVPETKSLAELLRELQASHQHLALVVDEYGGTAGLVTIEDLLEEIVGEIVDEHDEEEPEVEVLPHGRFRLDGMTSLDSLAELFDLELDLDEEPYETVGGMIFGQLGDLPEVGSEVSSYGLRFIVEKIDDRRVDSLAVWREDIPRRHDEEESSE